VHWWWLLPLATTLLASVVLVRLLRALDREAVAVVAGAAAVTPVLTAIGDAATDLRAAGSTMADAARRYTPRHG
jgi:hypothetical protein